jgi:diacylglycerol O-acyltransferase / wax synthase
VALTVVGGALRRYLLKHDELPDESLAAAVPISTRASSDVGAGGDQIDGTRVSLCTDVAGDVDRLSAISAATKDIRTVRVGVSAGQLSALSEVVPGQLLGTGLRAAAELATSYCDDFTISIVADRDMMPDMEFYTECLRDAYAGLAS